MHFVLFGFKRAHQATLRVTRPILRAYGLTPARLDLLAVLHERELSYIQLFQTGVRRILGVSAPTVCRMLQALERLDLVTRARVPRDLRQRRVLLTDRARELLRTILDTHVRSGAMVQHVHAALARHPSARPPLSLRRELKRVEDLCARVLCNLRDTAVIWEPWSTARLGRGS